MQKSLTGEMTAENTASTSEKTLAVKINRSVYAVPLGDIVYLENERRKIRLYMADKELLFYATFDQVFPKLDETFLRCSRSFILNMDHIRAMRQNSQDEIIMDNGRHILLGRTNFLRAKIKFDAYLHRKR